MSSGVGRRRGLDPELLWLWLWCRLAATAPIQPLAWEPPRAAGAALKTKTKQRKNQYRESPSLSSYKIHNSAYSHIQRKENTSKFRV